jgi:hypothetical protein
MCNVCSDVSEEPAASIFMMTRLVRVVAKIGKRKYPLMLGESYPTQCKNPKVCNFN